MRAWVRPLKTEPTRVNKNWVIGIDPGLYGAIAAYDLRTSELVYCVDMPIHEPQELKRGELKSRKVELNAHGIAQALKFLADHAVGALVEDVAAAPNQGVVSMFNFGYGQGVLYGALITLDIPTLLPKPSTWKSNMGLTRDKEQARRMAIGTFVGWEDHFSLKKHHGRAEAALLAKYGERIWKSSVTRQ
jgi:crossover junction endodeoxyribonuclease RuvC